MAKNIKTAQGAVNQPAAYSVSVAVKAASAAIKELGEAARSAVQSSGSYTRAVALMAVHPGLTMDQYKVLVEELKSVGLPENGPIKLSSALNQLQKLPVTIRAWTGAEKLFSSMLLSECRAKGIKAEEAGALPLNTIHRLAGQAIEAAKAVEAGALTEDDVVEACEEGADVESKSLPVPGKSAVQKAIEAIQALTPNERHAVMKQFGYVPEPTEAKEDKPVRRNLKHAPAENRQTAH